MNNCLTCKWEPEWRDGQGYCRARIELPFSCDVNMFPILKWHVGHEAQHGRRKMKLNGWRHLRAAVIG